MKSLGIRDAIKRTGRCQENRRKEKNAFPILSRVKSSVGNLERGMSPVTEWEGTLPRRKISKKK